MNGHHADVRTLFSAIDHLGFARFHVNPFDSFTGKRRAGWSHVKRQPVAVRRPGVDVGKLMIAGSEGDLFHEETLMRGYRIRVKHREELAYSFNIADQQDVRERANQGDNGDVSQSRRKSVCLSQITNHQRNCDAA
ncbi:hypothetical protein D3C71_1034980 [compost metagenome]